MSGRVKKQDVVQEEVSEEAYQVSKITGVMKGNNGSLSYLVNWSPTWQCETSLIGCEDLIEVYKDNNKNDIDGYGVGKNGKRVKIEPLPLELKSMLSSGEQSSGNSSKFLKKKSSVSYSSTKNDKSMAELTREADRNPSVQNCSYSSASGDVSAVVGIFYGKDNLTYYRVEWEPTWEEEENLNECGDIIQQFVQRELGLSMMAGRFVGDGLINIKEEEPASPKRMEQRYMTTVWNSYVKITLSSNLKWMI